MPVLDATALERDPEGMAFLDAVIGPARARLDPRRRSFHPSDLPGTEQEPAMADTAPGVTVAALSHDLVRRRSIVTLVWDEDPEKRVALPVPFGCSLDGVREEAERALRALAAEIAALPVNVAG